MDELVYIVEQVVNGILLGSMYALVSVGFTLIFGVLRIINFCHGELYMLGAYATFFFSISLGFDPLSATLLSLPFGFLLGFLIERGPMRFMRSKGAQESSFVLLTFGLLTLFQNIAFLLWGATNRRPPAIIEGTLAVGSMMIGIQRLLALVSAVCFLTILWVFLHKTKFGKATRAIAQDEEACKILGIDVDRYYSLTYALGAACAAFSGALLAPVFAVTPTAGTTPLLKAFVVVIIGGLGSVGGAMFAGVLIGVSETLGAIYFSPEYASSIGFMVMILVLIFKPSGLFGKSK